MRDRLGAWFLEVRGGLIRKSGRSVVRGLGVVVSDGMLKAAGLWRRELWYLNSVPATFPRGFAEVREGVPLPQPPDRLSGQVKLPEGWTRQELSPDPSVRARQRATEQEFWDELIERTWGSSFSPRDVTKQYWIDLVSGSYEDQYHDWCNLHKKKVKPFISKFMRFLASSACRSCIGPSKAHNCRSNEKGGLRSRLKSKPFWSEIARDRPSRKLVWVKTVVEEACDMPPAPDYMKEMVQRKIAIVRAAENPFWPKCSERWLDVEEAAERYVQ
jgi:hypothetical protein